MKKVDITDKLSFDENPCLVIKGKEIEVNSDAPTLLKVMNLMSSQNGTDIDNVLKAYELVLPDKSRKEIDKFKLPLKDLIVVIQTAIELVTDMGDSKGR